MKKIYSLILLLAIVAVPVFAAEGNAEKKANKEAYVTNGFWDNWFLSANIGATWNGDGLFTGGVRENFSGIGDLTAGKWLTPNWGLGLGLGVYGIQDLNRSNTYLTFNPHVNVYWDWTNQFGGYDPNRMYHAIPYAHFGGMISKKLGGDFTLGVGLLNKFCINEHWAINLDLRGDLVRGEQTGYVRGWGGLLNLMVGFTYSFNRTGWDVHHPCPVVVDNSGELADLQNAYQKLQDKNDRLTAENNELRNRKPEVINNAGDFAGVTFYYFIGETELGIYEKAHLSSYLETVIKKTNKDEKFLVKGHADQATGTSGRNIRLAQLRAEDIKNALVNAGVPAENITTKVEILNTPNVALDRAANIELVK